MDYNNLTNEQTWKVKAAVAHTMGYEVMRGKGVGGRYSCLPPGSEQLGEVEWVKDYTRKWAAWWEAERWMVRRFTRQQKRNYVEFIDYQLRGDVEENDWVFDIAFVPLPLRCLALLAATGVDVDAVLAAESKDQPMALEKMTVTNARHRCDICGKTTNWMGSDWEAGEEAGANGWKYPPKYPYTVCSTVCEITWQSRHSEPLDWDSPAQEPDWEIDAPGVPDEAAGEGAAVNTSNLTPFQKSVMLARLIPEWEVIEGPGYVRICKRGKAGPCLFQMTGLYNLYTVDDDANPHLMVWAWRVLNWAMESRAKLADVPVMYGAVSLHIQTAMREWFYEVMDITKMPSAVAQTALLDKVLELAIAAGLVEVSAAGKGE